MTQKTKMVLVALGGLVLPLGGIWLPFLIKAYNPDQRRFRLIFVISAAVCYLIGLGLCVHELKNWMVYEDPSFNPFWLLAPVVGLILPVLLFLPFTFKSEKVAYA